MLIVPGVQAQQVMHLGSNSQKPFQLVGKNQNALLTSLALPEINISQIEVDNEQWLELGAAGFGKKYEPGTPDLPRLVRLLAVPKDVNLQLDIQNYSESTIKLNESGLQGLIIPAQASVSKSAKNTEPLVKGPVYQQNKFVPQQVLELREAGIMRNVKLYELVYNPFLYNAVSNELLLRNDLTANITWNGESFNATSWDFLNIPDLNSEPESSGKSVSVREVYVVVSPLKYKETLQPFIHWKMCQGYQVIEAYIGELLDDNSKYTIKDYLKDLYENPTSEIPSPTYVLLVGDVIDIPTWNGTTDNHVTDLYYGEYTGDFLPEVYLGRFSVNDDDQLETIIQKTLYVEQAAEADGSYQNKHLLISGVDSDYAPIYGNGAVNYFVNNYSIPELGIEPSYYLYGTGSEITSNSSLAKQAILDDFTNGVGIAYYTAHCSASGWYNPEFEINDIASVSNTNKYPLMIGNCCQSYMFGGNSFGEEIVRVANKGAVAYIGATDYSYWDEDYYWGVGVTSDIVPNPTYEETGIGSWDAWFHTHNEAVEDYAFTAGELLYKGNMAVQASTSTLKGYYWEVYGIMGDPSLVPSKYRYQSMTPEYNHTLIIGQTSLTVKAVSGAKITLFEDENFKAFAIADASGNAVLNFNPLVSLGSDKVTLNIIHPDYLPYMDTLDVDPPDGPFVIVDSVQYKDTDGNTLQSIEYGQNISMYYFIKNYGNEDAANITLDISSTSEWITPLENASFSVDKLLSGESMQILQPVDVKLSNQVPDQEIVSFTGSIHFDTNQSSTYNHEIKVNSPELLADKFTTDIAGVGNLDGFISPDELVSLNVSFTNIGHAQVSNTVVSFSSSDPSMLTVLSEPIASGGFNPDDSKDFLLNVKAGSEFFSGSQVRLNYVIEAGEEQQFSFSSSLLVTLGEQPQINMTNGNEEIVSGYFFDSGGPDENYSDNENYTLTLIPHNAGEGLFIDFLEFGVESSNTGCWDKLTVFDGSSTSAYEIGKFCDNNALSHLQINNSEGALTFKFTSDESISKIGWTAYVGSSPMNKVNFKITDGINYLSDVLVTLDYKTDTSDIEGLAGFDYVLNEGTKSYTISKDGYFTQTGKIQSLEGDTTITVLMQSLPDICFTVHDATMPLENVTVTFDNRTLTTDADGLVLFENVSPGTKIYKASKNGFVDTSATVIVTNTDICMNIKMEPKTYGVHFTVMNYDEKVVDASISILENLLTTSDSGEVSLSGILPANAIPFSVSKEGFYTYNGSFDLVDADIEVEVNLTVVGVQENPEYFIHIFPNPLTKEQVLNIRSEKEIKELNLFNYAGQQFITKNNPAKEYSLNLSDFKSGIYILQVKLDEAWIVEKVIVK